MIRPAHLRLRKLRVLCATLFLLIASVSAPLALAAQSADSCGMACCVKEGSCCCNPRHASVKGQLSDAGTRISEPELSTQCPQGCGAALRTAKQLSRDYLRTGSHQPLRAGPPAAFRSPIVIARDFLESRSSAPRAPPASSAF